MRGPRAKTPLLLLLLLLLNALTGTVLCQDGEEETDEAGDQDEAGEQEATAVPDDAVEDGEILPSEPPPTGAQTSSSPEPALIETNPTDGTPQYDIGSGSGSGELPPDGDPEEEGLSPIIILIPVVLVVVIIGMIVCGIFINRRWNSKAKCQELSKEDPYLDGSSTEKVPMPMFEEDVPSVLELEMEELDQWMKKDYEAAEDSKLA